MPSWRGWCGLRRVLGSFAPQIVQTWLYHADFLGLLAQACGTRAALIWNLRCADMDLSRYRPLTARLVWVLARASGRPYCVIANSVAGQRHHQGLGYHPRRWAVIPNGFDVDKYHPDPAARARVCHALNLPPDTPLIGMIARVDPMKDHDTFLRAVARLRDLAPAAHCVLIGAGTESLAAHATALGVAIECICSVRARMSPPGCRHSASLR